MYLYIPQGIFDAEWMGGKPNSYWPNEFTYKIVSTNDSPDQSLLGTRCNALQCTAAHYNTLMKVCRPMIRPSRVC